MRGTERYHQARLAKARPVVLAYIGTDVAMRCFGKQTPIEAWLDAAYNPVEWRACVLSFGDFRESLTAQSSELFSALVESEMTAYTLTCDNADGYFTRLAAQEQILGGKLILMQGFEWPDFEASDFLPLFYGQISGFKNTKRQTVINADQMLKTEDPEDPSVKTTTTYALHNTSSSHTAAEEEVTYEQLTPVYENETWAIIIEVERTTETEEIFLTIVNQSDSVERLEIGVSADGNLYLTYVDDITDAGSTHTIAGPAIGEGTQRLIIAQDMDADPPIFTLSNNTGQSVETEIPTTNIWTPTTIANSISQPKSCAIDVQGNIYLCEDGAKMLQKYDADGSLVSEFSYGTGYASYVCLDEYGNIYVSSYDSSANNVRKYNSSGVLQWIIGGHGTGDGQFSDIGPAGLAVSPDSVLYVCDSGADRIQCFDLAGNFVSAFGTNGTGDGEFHTPQDIAFDTLGNFYVLDKGNNRIQVFDGASTSNFLYEFGNGEFNSPFSIEVSGWGECFVADLGDDCIHHFSYTHTYLGAIATGEGNFFGVVSKTIGDVHTLYATDFVASGNLLKISMAEVPLNIDFSDTTPTSNDVVSILPGNDNSSLSSLTIIGDDEPVVLWENVGEPSATDLVDQVGDLDLLIVDGVWTTYGEIDTYQAEVTDTIESFTVDVLTELGTTERYTNSSGETLKNVVLPLPYGDLIENSDAGVWVAPCIQSSPPHYCVAGWPILSVEDGNTISVYVDDVRRTSGWRFYPSIDYQSQGEIALIVFDEDYPDAESIVSVRCKGKVDEAGDLITNPVDVVEDWLDYVASLTGITWQADAASFAKARNDAAAYGYTCAGVITKNVTLGSCLQNILNSFLGAFRFNAEGKLEVWLQPMAIDQEVHEEILEYEAITLSVEQSIENVCRQIILYYALTTAAEDSDYYRYWRETSTRTVGDTWTLYFDWCRNADTIGMIASILLSLYADPEWILSYQGQDCKFLPLDMRDQVEATLSLVVNENGEVVADVPYSLREKTINLDDFTTTLVAQSVNFIQLAANPPGAVYISGDRVYINSEPVFIHRVL